MKNGWKYLGAGLVLLLCQVTLLPLFHLGRWTPDLFLLAVIAVAFYRDPIHGQLTGFAGGLVQDIFSAVTLGVHAFSRTLLAYLVSHARRFLYSGNVLSYVIVVFFASWLDSLILAILALGFPVGIIAAPSWQQPLSNTILAAVVSFGWHFYAGRRRSRYL